ncbi:hemerythrin domain-containing protein [Zoogloea sp.]|uniref:bacteriohemerythrin n=1 Tax=Zoogloea sp. TaxID=49181 RepID=UPI001416D786|nr:MAG: hemerythrin [Zoogloea sp.]
MAPDNTICETSLDWDDRYLVGHPTMDDTHLEFVELLAVLARADDSRLPGALDDLARHLEAHFSQENHWMKSTGFPAGECHVEEHTKVLDSLREVQEHLASGDTQIVRDFAEALADWFPGHTDYMDSALATWLVKASHGGAPLVLRRAKAPSPA